MSDAEHPTESLDRAAWIAAGLRGVRLCALTPEPFTCYDVARRHQLAEPAHPNHWGILMGIARAEGIVVPVAATPSARPKTARSLVRVWIGARFAARTEGAA
ncbi:MAG: hypothetical protein NTW05_28255 [Pseudonocardiales bacterium]|nr:hypothetical protein [Pseudonocardiales bacterium]